ncbi:hypothetical protein DLJ49_01580 [Rhodovulum sp. 12E13]|uniref:CmcI family methyltransferase n=1 Tax=Rhodovulum sp. 12E13 TaxID=2203891 RepID=UPI000E16773F|nr:CmcI family methyltransferase [Rhodovulum sp. 12E13]RDC75462.1 hypothetical protein DLJ49_01580 [Rhodovulum sp. 12E13]
MIAPAPRADTMSATVWSFRNVIDTLRDSVASERGGYLYVPVGKAANTEVKNFLWSVEQARGADIPDSEGYFSVHNDGWAKSRGESLTPWTHYGPEDVTGFIGDARRHFLFSVVRNPYSRLLSGYLDKIGKIRAANDPEAGLRQHSLPHLPESFSEFVEIVCAQPDVERDVHWTSQAARTSAAFLPYDAIGHLEALGLFLQGLAARFGMPPPETGNRAEHRTEASGKIAAHYTPEDIQRVRDAFAADFQAFGYSDDPAHLPPDPAEAAPVGLHAGLAESFAALWLAARRKDAAAYRAALPGFAEAESAAGRSYALPADFDPVHEAAVAQPLVLPRIPEVLCRVPAALAPAAAPSTEAQVAEVEEVRRAFRRPESGPGYSVDYARAFRLARGARCYVEVGSRDKGTLAWVSGLLAPDATIVDIDLEHLPEAAARLRTHLRPDQRLVQIEGNSVEEKTLFRLRREIGPEAADLIFLDSSHMYEHTRDEVAKYWTFLKPGGVMLVHDVFWEGNGTGKGKAQLFAALDRVVPVYQIYMNEALCRFHVNPRKGDTWGGFGLIVKPGEEGTVAAA